MRSRRRLAVIPVLLLALAACSDGTDAPDEDMTVPEITGEGKGATELPTVEDQVAALTDGGPDVDVAQAVVATIAAGATETGQVAETEAGPYVLRVVCTSSDGGPLTITVTSGESELTRYQAPCVPVFEGGTTMADSDIFQLPGGAVDVTVVAASESSVAVGVAPAAG